jgi:hypothetical protein
MDNACPRDYISGIKRIRGLFRMGSHARDSIILFFIKYPEPGKVKTRLAPSIGRKGASELYRYFILDILKKLESTGIPFKICFTPKGRGPKIQKWLGVRHQYAPQHGRGLGQRMTTAFAHAFGEGYRRCILIGSDFPDLPAPFLEESLDALDNNDAVIGPAVDGGYYLIGFRWDSFSPEVFDDMAWGSGTIFRETLSRLRGIEKKAHILPPWNDVDTVEDLRGLLARREEPSLIGLETMDYLSRLKID